MGESPFKRLFVGFKSIFDLFVCMGRMIPLAERRIQFII